MKRRNATIRLKSQRYNSDASIPSGFRGSALGKLPQFLRAALGIVIITLGIAGLTGCGEKTPTGAFNDWRKAILAGDIAAANKLIADDEASAVNALYLEAIKNNTLEGKILEKGSIDGETIRGNTAFVRLWVPEEVDWDGHFVEFVMLKVKGKWKMSHMKSEMIKNQNTKDVCTRIRLDVEYCWANEWGLFEELNLSTSSETIGGKTYTFLAFDTSSGDVTYAALCEKNGWPSPMLDPWGNPYHVRMAPPGNEMVPWDGNVLDRRVLVYSDGRKSETSSDDHDPVRPRRYG